MDRSLAVAALVPLAFATPALAETGPYGITEAACGLFGRTVTAHLVVHATPAQAFATLVDAERFPEFMPFLLSAKVVERHPTSMRVEFHARYFGWYNSHTIIERHWEPGGPVLSSTPEGPLKGSQSAWTLVPHREGTEIRYRNSVTPNFFVPAFAVSFLVNQGLSDLLESVRKRIESDNTWHKPGA